MRARVSFLVAMLSYAGLALASCEGNATGESQATTQTSETRTVAAGTVFDISNRATFEEPWAMAFEPGTGNLFITEKKGAIKFLQPNGRLGFVTGVPEVAYGGQGGLGDFAFGPNYTTSGKVYLSWAEAGRGGTRGAAVGRATLSCEDHDSCELRDLDVIWRQFPKVTGFGHYSARIAFSPDGMHLFVASGDRQKSDPAQDVSNTLGTIVRLNLDGTPAQGNPLTADPEAQKAIWSFGHRNILGLQFDDRNRLWALEHGPAGGDELNLVKAGNNYGWPIVSNGNHYDGRGIPDHQERPEFTPPAVSWTPVIAPGDFIFYSGGLFPEWRGNALIAGLKSKAVIRVDMDPDAVREVARYDFGKRLRDIAQGPDGAIWVLEDGDNGSQAHLLKLVPR